MNDYIETRLEVKPCENFILDILAYNLAEIGYESFVQDQNGLTAYIPKAAFDQQAVNDAVNDESVASLGAAITATHTLVEGEDWNAEWEKHYFKPIVVGNECVIHSSFHTDYPKCQYDIQIDPKMAFGTGHHATTTLILQRLLKEPLQGRSLIDVGTGTGILAILAAMRGAEPVNAIEIDPCAWENAIENTRSNATKTDINVILGDASSLKDIPAADYLVANINRNIVVADMPRYADAMLPGATAFFSGFYVEDVPIVAEAAARAGLVAQEHTSLDNWACLRVTK